jgi:hypothetical protein
VRWTLVFLHKPMWVFNDGSTNGWQEVEKLLAGRPYTVFAGHVHRYQKFIRNGQNYYQLATTGGASRLRGPEYGEFDHIVWVTMKPNGPVLANLMLDGIYKEDMKPVETAEQGVVNYYRRPTQPVRGQVLYEGIPVPGAYVVFQGTVKERPPRADAFTRSDGTFTLSTYEADDGAPAGEYNVTVVWRKPFYEPSGKPGPNHLPDKYAKADTTPLKFEVKSGTNEVILQLTK